MKRNSEPKFVHDLSGEFSTQSESGDFVLLFARTWSEKLQTQLKIARSASSKYHEMVRAESHNSESFLREENNSTAFREMWAEKIILVWMAHQLEEWLMKLAQEIGEEPPKRIENLKTLRNSLEHLNEASFDGLYAIDKDGKNKSLKKLPDSRLAIDSSVFSNSICLEEIEEIANSLTNRLYQELDDACEDYYTQQKIDEIRGK
jgi:transcriptional regulator with PAS, ATPase and Fis domain